MTTAIAHGSVTKSSFGKSADGTPVDKYTLTAGGAEADIITYGARLQALKTPDRDGKIDDIVLGHDDMSGYLADKSTYVGAIVGRYGNRIAHGAFTLDGKSYQIPKNNGENALHGGPIGFDAKVWQAHEIANGVELTLVSKDGEMGFPGTLTVHVRYTLSAHGKETVLRIDYHATTDKTTIVNVTNHAYFNLAGQASGSILNEIATLPADEYTPVDAGLIPTGIAKVAGTPFDFTKPTAIGARIGDDNHQLKYGGGYDHNWVLRGHNGELKTAAKMVDPVSGRVLTVTTTEPGVQFYTGNAIPAPLNGKGGAVYQKNAGYCLETQHYPDSPNHPDFPTTTLKPGETMHSTTIFTFTTQAK
ncbi:aldose epimerase family protein [Granulicella rosea]|nr:aldose epimerase family protein [Granulicella rosea]